MAPLPCVKLSWVQLSVLTGDLAIYLGSKALEESDCALDLCVPTQSGEQLRTQINAHYVISRWERVDITTGLRHLLTEQCLRSTQNTQATGHKLLREPNCFGKISIRISDHIRVLGQKRLEKTVFGFWRERLREDPCAG